MTRINVVPVEELTREELYDLLGKFDNKILTTAKYLGISRSKLERNMKILGVEITPTKGVRKKHKYSSDKVNNIYNKMVQRCTNPNNQDYKHYGGRGISIFESWLNSKDEFYLYVTNLENFWEEGYSIDRINNDGNYEPGNVRMVNKSTQANNTRRNRIINYKGEALTLMQFHKKYGEPLGFSYQQLLDRFELGFTPEEAIIIPKNKKRKSYK